MKLKLTVERHKKFPIRFRPSSFCFLSLGAWDVRAKPCFAISKFHGISAGPRCLS